MGAIRRLLGIGDNDFEDLLRKEGVPEENKPFYRFVHEVVGPVENVLEENDAVVYYHGNIVDYASKLSRFLGMKSEIAPEGRIVDITGIDIDRYETVEDLRSGIETFHKIVNGNRPFVLITPSREQRYEDFAQRLSDITSTRGVYVAVVQPEFVKRINPNDGHRNSESSNRSGLSEAGYLNTSML